MTLAAPLWLLALALVPLIRAWHRRDRWGPAWPVASIELWRGVSASAGGRRAAPDPAWRHRAAAIAALVLALAGPGLPGGEAPVTVWVDDRPSLMTVEGGRTRLAQGVAQVRDALGARADLQWRRLSSPWQALAEAPSGVEDPAVDAVVADLGAGPRRGAGGGTPPPALLDPGREHWLLTDGAASPGWAHRVLLAGAGVRRNVGIGRIGARRLPGPGDRLAVAVDLHNGGDALETRRLVVTLEPGPALTPVTRAVELAPGASTEAAVELAWSAGAPAGTAQTRLVARLEPGDALALDDTLALELRPLVPRRLALGPDCPASLHRAVALHPGLTAAEAERGTSHRSAAPDLRLHCAAAEPPADRLPTLWWRQTGLPEGVQGPWQGLDGLVAKAAGRWPGAALTVAGSLPAAPGQQVVLAVAGRPLLVQHDGPPRRVITGLDLDAAARTGVLPLWLDLALEQLLGQPLLDPVAAVVRPPGSHQVSAHTSSAAEATGAAPAGAPPRRGVALAPWLLALAALLLAADLVLQRGGRAP